MKKLCHECAEKLKYRPIKYTLGRCENCLTYTGVAECEKKEEKYDMPEGFEALFKK